MKRLLLLLPLLLFLRLTSIAQPVIKMRTTWDRPQVHVKFGEYTISFTIQHINKALQLIAEAGDSTNGTNCSLDTNGNYVVELYEGRTMIYGSRLQRLLHTELGAYLITAQRALIVKGKRKVIPEVIMEIEPPEMDLGIVYIRFYDPANHKLVFAGSMRKDMYNKDLGLD